MSSNGSTIVWSGLDLGRLEGTSATMMARPASARIPRHVGES